MADYAGQNPVNRVLDDEQARIDARNAALNLNGASPEKPTDPKTAMEGLSRQTQVPVNLLMAISDVGGYQRPEDAIKAATEAASRLAPLIKSGMDPKAALAQILNDPAAQDRVIQRAAEIRAQLYPDQQPPAQPAPQSPEQNDVRDAAAQVGKSVLGDAPATTVRGAGALAAGVAEDYANDPLGTLLTNSNPATAAADVAMKVAKKAVEYFSGQPPKIDPEAGKRIVIENPLNGLADAIQKWGGDTFDPYISDEWRQAMADSVPEAESLDPSTWTLGKSPSLRGYIGQTINVFGSLAPQVAIAIATRGQSLPTQMAAGMAVGASSGAGDQAQQAQQTIDAMWNEKTPDGRTRLEVESRTFQEFIAAGDSPEVAYQKTRSEAEKTAAMMAAPLSAILGAVEGKIFSPLEKKLMGKGVAGRAAQVGAGAGLEGGQEAIEGITGAVGSNIGAGTSENPFSNTLSDFILGALGGAGAGALGGLAPDDAPADAAQPATPNPAQQQPPAGPGLPPGAGPAPTAGLGGAPGAGAGGATSGAGTGPFSQATGAMPDTDFRMDGTFGGAAEKARPGQRYRFQTAATGATEEVQFVANTPYGPMFRFADGKDTVIPHDEFMNGTVFIHPFGTGGDRTAEPPPPFGADNGMPFETAKQAAKAAKVKLGTNQFTIKAVDGGFMVHPNPIQAEQQASAAPQKPDFSTVKPQSEAGFTQKGSADAAPDQPNATASAATGDAGGLGGGIAGPAVNGADQQIQAQEGPQVDQKPAEAGQSGPVSAPEITGESVSGGGNTGGPGAGGVADVSAVDGQDAGHHSTVELDGGKKAGKLAKVHIIKSAGGYRANTSYDIPGFAGGMGGSKPNQYFSTPEKAAADAARSIRRSVIDIAEGRAGSGATATHIAQAKKIVEWADKMIAAGTDKPAETSRPYILANSLSDRQKKTLGTHRMGNVGNVIGQLDAVARRAEADMRSRGENIDDHSDAGQHNTTGAWSQGATVIREAEQLARELLDDAYDTKGDLEPPIYDEETGELDYNALDTAMQRAAQFLEDVEAHNFTSDGVTGDGEYDPKAELSIKEDVFPEVKGTISIEKRADKAGRISQEDADARLTLWKQVAKDVGKTGLNAKKIVISLFDYSGQWSQPWRDAGYQVIQLDIKTGTDMLRDLGRILETVAERRSEGFEVFGVLSACPCTTFSGAGARWWENLHDLQTVEALVKVFGPDAPSSGAKSPLEYNVKLVDATRDVVQAADPTGFYVLENPVGRIGKAANMPQPVAQFHPHNFGDPYTKRTHLYGEMKADLPLANVEPTEGSKMQSKLRGTDSLGKEARSTTPMGFSYAFFMANDPEARKRMDEVPAPVEKPASVDAPPDFDEEKAKSLQFRKDNPGGSWLAGKIADRDAKQAAASPNTMSANRIGGATTAYFKAPFFLPTDMVAALPGVSGEKRAPGDRQYDMLASAVDADGFKEDQDGNAIMVTVNDKGKAFIVEGNTRAAVAKARGVESVRVEVQWMNGAEAVDGDLTPAKVIAAASLTGPGNTSPKVGAPKLNETLQEQHRVKRGIAVAIVAGVPFKLLDRDGSVMDIAPLVTYLGAANDGEAVLTFQRADEKSTTEHGLPAADPNPIVDIENDVDVGRVNGAKPTINSDAQALLDSAVAQYGVDPDLTTKLAVAVYKIDAGTAKGLITRGQMAEALSYSLGNGTGSTVANAANPNPTPAQAEAGNYKMKHIDFQGLDISIETEKGVDRKGTAPDGTEWSVTMPADYGYIKGTVGKDKDHIDVYVGPNPFSTLVVVIDQNDLASGAFDEHKVMLGFDTGEAALAAYKAGFSDGEGAARIGGVREMSIEKLKLELAKPARWLKPISEKYDAGKPRGESVPVIKDFGEKIGGARKDKAAKAIHDLRADRNTTKMTMAEAFPEPDYAALEASGIPKATLALVALLRNRIETKPHQGNYKLRYWAEKVDVARSQAADLIEGIGDMAAIVAGARLTAGELTLMGILGSSQTTDFAELSRFKINDGAYFRPNYDLPAVRDGWSITSPWQRGSGPSSVVATEVEVASKIETMRQIHAKFLEEQKKAGPDKSVSFSWRRETRGPSKVFQITFRVGAKSDSHDVPGEVYLDIEEARRRVKEDVQELVDLTEDLRVAPEERRTTNNPRLGPKHRTGDVTPEMFTKAFGFRGVEFGNWNTGKDRQTRLNEAYDALFDMAGALGIPTTSISLNGKLGLAFGSRGIKGAAAHYEPDRVVINLTKEAGAGSLVHEWWHALDNFIAKIDGTKTETSGTVTSAAHTGKGASQRTDYMSDRGNSIGSADRELREAFRDLRRALNDKNGAWRQRSEAYDKMRSSPYFATMIELAARGFEKMVLDRLYHRRMANDFLVNINEGGTHPTSAELRRIGATQAYTDIIDLLDRVLPKNDGAMVELPPIDTTLLYDGPAAGETWNGYQVTRKVVERVEGNFYVLTTYDDPALNEARDEKARTRNLDLEQVEDLIEQDQRETRPANIKLRLAKEAIEKANAAAYAEEDKWIDRAAEFADAYDVAIGSPVGTTRRVLADSTYLAGIRDMPIYKVVVMVLKARGFTVGSDNLYTPEGTSWKSSVWPGRAIHFAKWIKAREQHEADAAATKAALDALLNEEPAPVQTETAPNLSDMFDELLDELLPEDQSEGPAKQVQPRDEVAPETTATEAPVGPDTEAGPTAAPENVFTPADKSDPETVWDSAGEALRLQILGRAGWTVQATGEPNEAAKRSAKADWADLTPTAKKKAKEGIDATSGIGSNSAATQPPTFTEAIKDAGTNLGEGLGAALDGLMNLFGNKNTLRMGFSFDEQDYQRAKPFFITAAKAFGAAGRNVRDAMRALMQMLIKERGMDRAGLAAMKPYIERFASDIEAGLIDLSEPQGAPTNDPGTVEAGNPEPLGDELPGDVSQAGQGVAPPAGGGAGNDVPAGNAAPDQNGDVSSGGVGGGIHGDASPVPGTDPQQVEADPLARSGENPGNFVIDETFPLGEGTTGERLDANVRALQIMKALDAENRYPTRAEQAAMARYVGWGGLKTVFDPKHEGKTDQYGRAQALLKSLLSKEEYDKAFDSISNAHYTSRRVVQAMWRAMRHFGYSGGRALEPTVGAGNFLGLQPVDLMSATEWHGSDIDVVTGKLASYLYPDANILGGVGFQKADFLRGVFDIAIGNPPFGGETIRDDKRADLSGMKIHNYIITKAGIHLRPGGVMAMVVTHRFLDTRDAEGRSQIDKDFRFIGAIRLPNNAFKENAGTDVVTDMVFFQKRREGDDPSTDDKSWLDVDGKITEGKTEIRVNRYFQENPTHILGRSAMDGTMYGRGKGNEYTVHSDDRDVATEVERIIGTTWGKEAGILGGRDENASGDALMENVSTLPIGGMMIDEKGRVMRREPDNEAGAVVSEVTEQTFWHEHAAIWDEAHKAMIALRDAMKDGRGATVPLVGDLLHAARIVMNSDGTRPTKKPTAAAQAIFDALDKRRFTDDGMKAVAEMVSKRRLGADRYKRLKGMLDLRGKLLKLIQQEIYDGFAIEPTRTALRNAYEAFTKEFGPVNHDKNAAVMQGDVGVETSLESVYEPAREGRPEKIVTSPMLQRRVNFPYRAATSAKDPEDGLHVSISERGHVDLGFIASLTKMSLADVKADLMNRADPLIFLDPATDIYEPAEVYLSGNVVKKLQEARDLGATANIGALVAAQPKPKTQAQITPSIRSMWMPTDIMVEFLEALGLQNVKVVLMKEAATWNLQGDGGRLSEFGMQFQHRARSVLDMVTAAVTGKVIKIMERVPDGKGGMKEQVNEADTRDVNALVERLANEFESWAYTSGDRVKRIVDAYNKTMNTHVDRKFDGVRYLRIVGANIGPDAAVKSIRNSQKNGAWRMMVSPSTLVHHVVGAGKTFTAIISVMERKRMGLSRKSMIAVPNHLVGQWAKDFYKLYPGAKILAASPADFTKSNRKRLLSRIATGEYDAVIIGHSSLKFIAPDPNDERDVIQEQVDILMQAGIEAKAAGADGATLSQIRKRLVKYRERLEDLAKLKRDDLGFNFREMGIDNLIVDEAHEFKNLEYQTSAQRLVGMNDPKGSDRAFDLFIKMRGLSKRGGSMAFMTGTPISNSLVEIYAMMKFLAWDALKDRGQAAFDAWASSYVHAETRFEYTATQKLVERRVLSKLVNLSSLSQIYRSFADVMLQDDVKRAYAEQVVESNRINNASERAEFPIPKVKGGSRQLLHADASSTQQEFTNYLVMRMHGIKNAPDKKEYARIDNALWVLTDARKASIDVRTVDPTLDRDPQSKVVRSGNEIKRIYDAWNDKLGTQLVFSDMSTPSGGAAQKAREFVIGALVMAGMSKKDAAAKVSADTKAGVKWTIQWSDAVVDLYKVMEDENTDSGDSEKIETWLNHDDQSDAPASMAVADTGFSVYDDLRSYLVEQGIPKAEIAFIHDFVTDEAKVTLYADMNAGRVRVLLGSTPKLGAGTNVQERLVALHHLDAPWRPSDIEQREGRVIRQGNSFYDADPDGFEVEILAYSTNGTSDVVLWQGLERKSRGIETFLRQSADVVIEESGDADVYANFMAETTGNPIYLLKLQTEKAALAAWAEISGRLAQKSDAEQFLVSYPGRVERLQRQVAIYKNADPTFIKAVVNSKVTTAQSNTVGDAIDMAQAAFDTAESTYAAETQAIEEAKAKGVPVKDRPKRTVEEKPKRPTGMWSPEVRAASPYAQLTYDMMASLVAARMSPVMEYGRTEMVGKVEFRVGSWPIFLEKRSVPHDTSGRVHRYAVLLEVPELGSPNHPYLMNLGQSDVIDPLTSQKLAAALHPDNIAGAIKDAKDDAKMRLDAIEAEKPIMADRAATAVDRSHHNALEQASGFYFSAVALAELQAEKDRAGKTNRFALNDTRRNLRGAVVSQQIDAVVTFSDPVLGNFTSTGPGVKLSGMTPIYGIGYIGEVFPAKRDTDGHEAIIFANGPMTSQGVTNAREAKGVILDPRGADGKGDVKRMRRGKPETAARAAWDLPSGAVIDTDGVITEGEPEVTPTVLAAVYRIFTEELTRMGLAGMDFRLSNRISDGEGYPIWGYFTHATKELVVAWAHSPSQMLNTLRHEAIHALRSPAAWNGRIYGAFTRQEWKLLESSALANIDLQIWAKRAYGDLTKDQRTEEVIAEMFSKWAARRDSGNPLAHIYQKMLHFFEAMVNAFRGHGFTSSAALFERIITEGLSANVAVSSNPVGYGMESDAAVAASRSLRRGVTPEQEAGIISKVLTQAMAGGRRSLLGLVPARALFGELGAKMPSLRRYQDFKDKMDTLRNDWQTRSDATAKRWQAAIAKNRGANDRMMALMHETTILGHDPSVPFVEKALPEDFKMLRERTGTIKQREDALNRIKRDRAERAVYDGLKAKFDGLPKAFQRLYEHVRDEYKAMADAYEKAILANIVKAAEINLRRAERIHADEMKRIRDMGLIGGERTIAMEAADAALERAKDHLKSGGKARAFALRKQFESNRVPGPYFPLTRFGKFFITERNADGKVVKFSMFETVWARDKAAIAAHGQAGITITTGAMDDKDGPRGMVDPTFVAEVEHILSGIKAPKAVMDAIWQKWLESLPELSIRRNRIHRNATPGFHTDAFRAFGRHTFHGAHQLARLTYTLDLNDALVEARREAALTDSPTRSSLVVSEAERQNEFTMNPSGARWSQFLTAAGFIYFMAFSPSTALGNLTQTTIVGIPVLAGMHGGSYRQAAGQITRASLDFFRGKGHAVESSRLTDDEKAAMREAYKSGLIDKSQSHDLAGVESHGIEYRNWRAKFMAAASWMLHHTERMNREITFLAAYRVARLNPDINGDTRSHEAAIDEAMDRTWKTHFDYQNTARPRFAQGDVARVALSMKNFQINMLWRLFRDIHQSIHGETPEVQREARKTLFGITASMMLHAGVSGTWLFGASCMIASLIFGGTTADMKDEFKTATVETFGEVMGAAVFFGIPQAVTGASISPRIGMPDLWFRDETRPAEGEALYQQWVAQALGAIPSIGENVAVGLKDIKDGNVGRGLEQMAPKPVRDLMKSYRYFMEGATTKNGDPLVDEVTTAEVITQALGYTPARIAEQTNRNALAYARQDRIQAERSKLMGEAADLLMNRQPLSPDLLGRIEVFRIEHPTYGIRAQDLRASVHSRLRNHARNVGGATLNPRLEDEIFESLSPNVFDW